ELTRGPFLGAQIPFNGTFTDFDIEVPGDRDFPFDPGPGLAIEKFDYRPNLTSNLLVPGIRTHLTDVDIAIIGNVLQVETVPEPPIWIAGFVGTIIVSTRRRRRQ
ncbi:MAG: hypothetical protein AAF664_03190, partial [Planctomycetota bacterium]